MRYFIDVTKEHLQEDIDQDLEVQKSKSSRSRLRNCAVYQAAAEAGLSVYSVTRNHIYVGRISIKHPPGIYISIEQQDNNIIASRLGKSYIPVTPYSFELEIPNDI